MAASGRILEPAVPPRNAAPHAAAGQITPPAVASFCALGSVEKFQTRHVSAYRLKIKPPRPASAVASFYTGALRAPRSQGPSTLETHPGGLRSGGELARKRSPAHNPNKTDALLQVGNGKASTSKGDRICASVSPSTSFEEREGTPHGTCDCPGLNRTPPRFGC